MIPGIFDDKSEPEWRRALWKQCIEYGMGKTFLFNAPRGKNVALFKIAAFGFEKQYKVLTVHLNRRCMNFFRDIDIKVASQRFCSTTSQELSDEILDIYDVIIVNDKKYISYDFGNLKNKTLFFIG